MNPIKLPRGLFDLAHLALLCIGAAAGALIADCTRRGLVLLDGIFREERDHR